MRVAGNENFLDNRRPVRRHPFQSNLLQYVAPKYAKSRRTIFHWKAQHGTDVPVRQNSNKRPQQTSSYFFPSGNQTRSISNVRTVVLCGLSIVT